MVTRTLTRLSVAEYLALERESEIKLEYDNGEVYEMPRVSRRHSRIEMNVTLALGAQLAGSDCQLHSANLGVKIGGFRYYFPDLTVVCGEEIFDEEGELTLVNPSLVMEVTSPSSILRDRGEKLIACQGLPSLEAVLIIDQHRVQADLHTRESDGRRRQTFTETEDIIPLPMLKCDLPLEAIYQGVALEAPAD